jgi:hypothetical protein
MKALLCREPASVQPTPSLLRSIPNDRVALRERRTRRDPLFIFGFAASHYALRKRNEKTVMTAKKSWRESSQIVDQHHVAVCSAATHDELLAVT